MSNEYLETTDVQASPNGTTPEEKAMNELLDAYDKLVNDYMVAERQELVNDVNEGKLSKDKFMEQLSKDVSKKYPYLSEKMQNLLCTLFDDRYFGYWWIQPLITDPDISDIHMYNYKNIRIKKKGQRGPSGVSFRSQQEFENFVQYLATKNHIAIDQRNATQRVADDETYPYFALRFTINTEVLTSNGKPYVVLRKFPRVNFPTMDDLVEKEMMDEKTKDYLISRFKIGSILICGGNSQGKSTLLNALKETIDHDKAVLVVQQADELSTNTHPDMLFLHEVPATSESSASYTLEVLANTALTLDVDYFIIGEIKDAEANTFINAAMSGQICAGTLHSDSCLHAMDRAADLAMKRSTYSKKEVTKMLECFKTVVYVEKFKIKQIVEIKRYNTDTDSLDYDTVFSLIDDDSIGADE